jgi:hypothetical protein
MTMLGLHTGTLALSVSLIATLLAVGNLVVWRQTREQAMLWWAAGSLTIAVATTVSQLLPAAVLFAYLPIALTLCFYWIGIQSFQRRALQKARIAIYAGACAVVFLGFAASGPANDYYRVSIVAVLIASLSGACAYELLTRHRGVARDASRFVGMLFSINALIFVLFSLYAPPADADIATLPDSLRLATYAAVLTLVIGWNFGFVMMVMQRYLDVAIELSTHDDLTGVLTAAPSATAPCSTSSWPSAAAQRCRCWRWTSTTSSASTTPTATRPAMPCCANSCASPSPACAMPTSSAASAARSSSPSCRRRRRRAR